MAGPVWALIKQTTEAILMEHEDVVMKRAMTYLFTGLFGVFLSIIYMVNMIVY